MQHQCVRLQCPECHKQTLACAIQHSAGVVDVRILHQTCDCDAYANWDDVWEQAREVVMDGEVD